MSASSASPPSSGSNFGAGLVGGPSAAAFSFASSRSSSLMGGRPALLRNACSSLKVGVKMPAVFAVAAASGHWALI